MRSRAAAPDGARADGEPAVRDAAEILARIAADTPPRTRHGSATAWGRCRPWMPTRAPLR